MTPLVVGEGSAPLGTAWLSNGTGVDLAAAGYREDEYLVAGTAGVWGRDRDGAAVLTHSAPYVTRVLVRRPIEEARFTGVVEAEPLHQEYDAAMSWRAAHRWIIRTGAAWMGVTQDPRLAASMRDEFDPVRYAPLSIPKAGMGFDIVGDVARAARAGLVPALSGGCRPRRIHLSGWSATGSFCRAFLGDGFHDRHRREDGAPPFDGYLIGISSGGAVAGGYPQLSEGAARPPVGDSRRTIAGYDVPVVELLSELESETQGPCLRPDADALDDRYRLYQVAGTSHDSFGPRRALTNQTQYRERGFEVPARRTNEPLSDAPGQVVAHAAYALLDRWARDGAEWAPPRAPRFELTDEPPDHANPTGEARALRRDAFGNAVGGIRTPWIEAPLATYVPSSTPAPGMRPSRWAPPGADPTHIAALTGSARPFSERVVRELYASREDYVRRYAAACDRLVEEGLLLTEDAAELVADARERPLPLPLR